MKLHTILSAACLLLLGAFTLQAQEHGLINYQGRLTDSSGNPVSGNVQVEVLVYDAPTGGNLTYSENIGEVAVTNGTYSFQFGSAGDGIIGVLVGFSDYLALRVNGVEESTRTRLLAVPYAIKAWESADAQELLAEARVLSVSEENLDFGGVLPGGSRSRQVSVTNEGFRKLEIYGVELPEGFSIDPSIQETITLRPWETVNATITFAPQAVQAYSGNITILSDKTSGLDSIPCFGEAVVPTALMNGETRSGLAAAEDSRTYFSFHVPWYATSLLFQTSNGTGDVDLFVRYGDLPTFSEWNYAPWQDGNEELVNATPTPGEWFAMLYGYNLYSGVDFLVKYEGAPPEFVYVEGGILPQSSELAGTQVVDFEICEYEVTWAEWQEVRDWAVENGYDDLADVGQGNGARHPVQNVNWFQVIKWLNAKSEMEGLVPAYTIGGEVYRSGEFGWSDPNILQNSDSNGYRLPSEAEWEWAARGGILSQGFTYSGSNDPDAVAWHAGNSGGTTHPVGTKLPNELGLYDMSGNVIEWVWDYYTSYGRRNRGGGFYVGLEHCTVTHRNNYGPNDTYLPVHGFRLARSVEQPMVTVQGGTLVTTNELNGAVVSTFEIGKYEVTWAEWQDVRDWAVANGYSDLAGVGAGSAGDNPVRDVIWYNVVKWINAKSERHGFVPVYRAGGEVYRSGQSVPDLQNGANGYRLPSEVEWEWAARGGLSSQSYTYSGSTDANAVAWTAENSSGAAVNLNNGRGTWSVGLKAHNELGISDMSGNVWEWCQDLVGSGRRIRGGSWNSGAVYAVVAYRGLSRNPNQNNYDVGFRLARSSEL